LRFNVDIASAFAAAREASAASDFPRKLLKQCFLPFWIFPQVSAVSRFHVISGASSSSSSLQHAAQYFKPRFRRNSQTQSAVLEIGQEYCRPLLTVVAGADVPQSLSVVGAACLPLENDPMLPLRNPAEFPADTTLERFAASAEWAFEIVKRRVQAMQAEEIAMNAAARGKKAIHVTTHVSVKLPAIPVWLPIYISTVSSLTQNLWWVVAGRTPRGDPHPTARFLRKTAPRTFGLGAAVGLFSGLNATVVFAQSSILTEQILLSAVAATICGCVVGGVLPTIAAVFDESWNAASIDLANAETESHARRKHHRRRMFWQEEHPKFQESQYKRSYGREERQGSSGDSMTLEQARAVLGVDQTAKLQDIKRAFRQAAMKCHPDRRQHAGHLGREDFRRVIMAYECLVGRQRV